MYYLVLSDQLSTPLFSSPSDVMTVLRQLQTFLLTQHSRNQAALQDFILRALLGVCQVRKLSTTASRKLSDMLCAVCHVLELRLLRTVSRGSMP